MKKLSFRIRRQYFDAIVAGEKTVEYRRDIGFWHTRIATIYPGSGSKLIRDPGKLIFVDHTNFFEILCNDIQAVFICGKRIHRREVVSISRIKTPEGFSDQGKADVNTPTCLAFFLGRNMDEV